MFCLDNTVFSFFFPEFKVFSIENFKIISNFGPLQRMSRRTKHVSKACKAILTRGPVPERPISANPGLKFCSTFCIYLPMQCLE